MATRRTAAHAANQSYTETIADAQNDDTRDKSATGDPLVMTDAANVAVAAYDPQQHEGSTVPVLTPQNPGLVYDPALANAGLSDEQVAMYQSLTEAQQHA